jgi:CheY-like chemotaxis protein
LEDTETFESALVKAADLRRLVSHTLIEVQRLAHGLRLEAERRIIGAAPNMALVDISMPPHDGIEVIRRVGQALVSGADLSEDFSITRREPVRSVTVFEGTVRLQIEIEPCGGAEAEPRRDGLLIRCEVGRN